jgi:hypothetical protein
VATAALECGCHQKAAPLVKAVLAKFPESLRAKRLQASRRALGRRPDGGSSSSSSSSSSSGPNPSSG